MPSPLVFADSGKRRRASPPFFPYLLTIELDTLCKNFTARKITYPNYPNLLLLEQPTFGPQRYPKKRCLVHNRRLVEHGDNNYSLELLFSLWETNLSYRNRALNKQLCWRFGQLGTLLNWRSYRRENFTQYALAGDLSNGVGHDPVKNLVRLVLAKYFLR